MIRLTDDDILRMEGGILDAIRIINGRLDRIDERLTRIPDFDMVHPMVDLEPSIVKTDKVRAAIVNLYWSGAKRKCFTTKMLKGELKSRMYNSILYRLCDSGEILRVERGLYEMTDDFLRMYAGALKDE